jgi:hypothetical protein
MGHYDSCRDSTWSPKLTPCEKSKDKKHLFLDHGHGVQICKHCGTKIFYT